MEEAEANYAKLRKQADDEIAAKLRAEGKEPEEIEAPAMTEEMVKKEEPAVAAPVVVAEPEPQPVAAPVKPASDIGVVRPVMPRKQRSEFNVHMPLPR